MPTLQTLELVSFMITKDRLRKLILAKCPKLEGIGLQFVKIMPKNTVVPTRGRQDLLMFVRSQSQNIAAAQNYRQTNSTTRQPLQIKSLGSATITTTNEKYVRSVKRYLADSQVYPMLDLFPGLESIVVRPATNPNRTVRYSIYSVYFECPKMIQETCHNLHSLIIDTYPPDQDTWRYLVKCIPRLTHLSLGNMSWWEPFLINLVFQYQQSTLESIHVDLIEQTPGIILRFLQACPRLRKWSCSSAVIFSEKDLENSLMIPKDKTRCWPSQELEELLWPENFAGFQSHDIDRLVASLQHRPSVTEVQRQLESLKIDTDSVLAEKVESG
ncbi:hypothetical protein BGZ46_006061 [Entomortierella lignicola]|nr:hypothetical protein BGZ46_006061 [Entomortierella lignicola]